LQKPASAAMLHNKSLYFGAPCYRLSFFLFKSSFTIFSFLWWSSRGAICTRFLYDQREGKNKGDGSSWGDKLDYISETWLW
jgi:hypothetical protein